MDSLPLEIIDTIKNFLPIETFIRLRCFKEAKKRYNKDIHTWDWAIDKNDIKFILFLVYTQHTERFTTWYHYKQVCIYCDTDILEFLYNYTKYSSVESPIFWTVIKGNIDNTKFLYSRLKRKEEMSKVYIDLAIFYGKTDVVKFFLDNGIKFSQHLIFECIDKQYIETINCLYPKLSIINKIIFNSYIIFKRKISLK